VHSTKRSISLAYASREYRRNKLTGADNAEVKATSAELIRI
jgi:hypothetical protein